MRLDTAAKNNPDQKASYVHDVAMIKGARKTAVDVPAANALSPTWIQAFTRCGVRSLTFSADSRS